MTCDHVYRPGEDACMFCGETDEQPLDEIQRRFLEFHLANPHVYKALVRLAREAKDAGYKRIGIELLFAVLRWETMMQTRDPSSDFKLNDHYTSRYARLIMSESEDLDGLFEVRALSSERKAA